MRSVYCLHGDTRDVDSFKRYLYIDSQLDNVNLIWDCESPDILFSTEHIYSNKRFWNQFKQLSQKAKVNIFYSLEAATIDFNIFDIGITWDNSITGPRHCQVLPTEDIATRFITKKENEIRTAEEARKLLDGRKFCNFLYSNGVAHPMRDKLFYELSKYKRVDSLGKHQNNVEMPGTGYEGHAVECVGIKNGYKFSIACENAWFPGYTTEKILTSLEAHTIPIYWGNKDITKDINPECFVNVMEFDNLENMVKRVREIDEDNNLWSKMVSQPWYTKEQNREKVARRNAYFDMMHNIFTGDIHSLIFRGQGTWENQYRDFYYRKGPRNMFQKVMNRLGLE